MEKEKFAQNDIRFCMVHAPDPGRTEGKGLT